MSELASAAGRFARTKATLGFHCEAALSVTAGVGLLVLREASGIARGIVRVFLSEFYLNAILCTCRVSFFFLGKKQPR